MNSVELSLSLGVSAPFPWFHRIDVLCTRMYCLLA
jgi:hypothetical protein